MRTISLRRCPTIAGFYENTVSVDASSILPKHQLRFIFEGHDNIVAAGYIIHKRKVAVGTMDLGIAKAAPSATLTKDTLSVANRSKYDEFSSISL